MKRAAACTCLALAAYVSAAPFGLAATVDFDELTPGTSFGGHVGDNPGDVVHVEDLVSMSIEEFFVGSFVGFNTATVGGRFVDLVDTTDPLDLHNISVRFDFANLSFAATSVKIEYWCFGGANELAVNDETIHSFYSFNNLPANVASGVAATAADGTVTLDGPIHSFRIGGQELSIDNMIAIPEPVSLILLAFGVVALIRPLRGQTR